MKPLDSFYDECIGSKILQCDLRSSGILRKPPCARRRAEINRAQAAFYEDHREELIKSMLGSNLGKDLAKINTFLVKAFLDFIPGSIFSDEYASIYESKREMAEGIDSRYREILEPEDSQYLYEPPWSCGALIDEED